MSGYKQDVSASSPPVSAKRPNKFYYSNSIRVRVSLPPMTVLATQTAVTD